MLSMSRAPLRPFHATVSFDPQTAPGGRCNPGRLQPVDEGPGPQRDLSLPWALVGCLVPRPRHLLSGYPLIRQNRDQIVNFKSRIK